MVTKERFGNYLNYSTISVALLWPLNCKEKLFTVRFEIKINCWILRKTLKVLNHDANAIRNILAIDYHPIFRQKTVEIL